MRLKDMLKIKVIGGKKLHEDLSKFSVHSDDAARLAMNRVTASARTAALVNTRKYWNIRARDLKGHTSIKRATKADLAVEFTVKSGGVPLKEFVTPAYLRLDMEARQQRKGVSYKVKKDERAKTFKGAFMNKSKARHNEYVLKREGKDRYPLIPLTVVTPTYMFENTKSDEVFIDKFLDMFDARFAHELARKSAT